MVKLDMGQGFHTLLSLLTMVKLDMGQEFHTLMSLLTMVQLDMGQGFNTLMSLLTMGFYTLMCLLTMVQLDMGKGLSVITSVTDHIRHRITPQFAFFPLLCIVSINRALLQLKPWNLFGCHLSNPMLVKEYVVAISLEAEPYA